MGARWSKQREAGFEEAGANGGDRQSKVGTSFESGGACKNCRPADEVSLPKVGLNWCEMEYNKVAECMRREKGSVRDCVTQWDEFRVCREAAKKSDENPSK